MFGRKYTYCAVQVGEDGRASFTQPSCLAGTIGKASGGTLELKVDAPLHKGDVVRVNDGQDEKMPDQRNYFEVVRVIIQTDRTEGDKQKAVEGSIPCVIMKRVSDPFNGSYSF